MVPREPSQVCVPFLDRHCMPSLPQRGQALRRPRSRCPILPETTTSLVVELLLAVSW